ncbi:unnamed protein product [Peniophora sp. CBMAI 1063]|nr:unnamed protein product [Peniophora sp. CBMAI 1063]
MAVTIETVDEDDHALQGTDDDVDDDRAPVESENAAGDESATSDINNHEKSYHVPSLESQRRSRSRRRSDIYAKSSAEAEAGDELWESYLDAAAVEDQALVARLKQSSTSTLRYSALFSLVAGIFTTYSINTLSTLSPPPAANPGDQTVALLAQWASSKLKNGNSTIVTTESGNTTVADLMTGASSTTFTPPKAIVVASTLWSLSLVLAVMSAISSGMMAQWASNFEYALKLRPWDRTTIERHALRHIEVRVSAERYGLDILPDIFRTMLHIAVVLFLIGLAMWPVPDEHVHTGIAIAAASLIGLGYIFFGALKLQILGALKLQREIRRRILRGDVMQSPGDHETGLTSPQEQYHDKSPTGSNSVSGAHGSSLPVNIEMSELRQRGPHTQAVAEAPPTEDAHGITTEDRRESQHGSTGVIPEILLDHATPIDAPDPACLTENPSGLARSNRERAYQLPWSLKLLMFFLNKEQKQVIDREIDEALYGRDGIGPESTTLPPFARSHSTQYQRETKPKAGRKTKQGASVGTLDEERGRTEKGQKPGVPVPWWHDAVAAFASMEESDEVEKGMQTSEGFRVQSDAVIEPSASVPPSILVNKGSRAGGDPGPSTQASRMVRFEDSWANATHGEEYEESDREEEYHHADRKGKGKAPQR